MKKKLNLKEFMITKECLDLSMIGLEHVPEKEIAALTKAITNLDLSNNSIAVLSYSFSPCLTRLVKLDLSHNKLTELPQNFGLLTHLKHLDLYKNKLTNLPMSFGCLKELRWLDLKDNPLKPTIANIIGPCLDDAQCQNAAKRIVYFLSEMQKEIKWELLEEDNLHLQMRKEEEEDKSRKKENKKKKKKKVKISEDVVQTVQENGTQPVQSKETLEKTIDRIPKEIKKPNTSGLSIWNGAVSLFSGFVQLIAYTVVLSMLSIFFISMLDDGTCQAATVKLLEFSNLLNTRLSETWNKTMLNVSNVSKQIIENASIMFRWGIIKIHEGYIWFSTDEKVQLYIETFKNYFYIAFFKTTEYGNAALNHVTDYIKRTLF